MRTLSIFLVTLMSAIGASNALGAPARGQAIIAPYIAETVDTSNGWYVVIAIANTSRKKVSVSLALYDKIGGLIADTEDDPRGGNLTADNVDAYADSGTDASVTFDIAPGQTGQLIWGPQAGQQFGYGRIEWKQNASAAVTTLIAHAIVQRKVDANVVAAYALPINNGLPF